MTQLLEALLLAAHLLCVNVASAAPLVVIWWDWREGRGDAAGGEAGRYLAGASVVALIVGAVLGVGIGASLWTDDFQSVLTRLHDRVFYGVLEWITSLVLVVGHYYWWKARPTAKTGERVLRCLVAFGAGTNLIYHFPVLFYVIQQVEPEGLPLTSAEFRSALISPYVVWRSLHFAAAAFATCGVLLLGYAIKLNRLGRQDDGERIGRAGGRLALAMTVMQLPIGFFVVLTTPRTAQMAIMGKDAGSSGLFLLSMLAAFYLMHQLGKTAFTFSRNAAIQAMAVLVLVIVMMSWVSVRI